MIGGKIVDPSALAAYVRGDSIALQAWLVTGKDRGLVLVAPQMALAEVRMVYPDSEQYLAVLLDFPWVLQLGLTRSAAVGIGRLLAETSVWDGTAGHVILVARERGWPVLTTDPARLTRIAPDVDVDLL